MKPDIHPKYYKDAQVTCVCGAQFTVGSTLPEIKLDLCSACHPFYTGQQKLLDVEGRVERFQKKYAKFNKKKEAPKSQDSDNK